MIIEGDRWAGCTWVHHVRALGRLCKTIGAARHHRSFCPSRKVFHDVLETIGRVVDRDPNNVGWRHEQQWASGSAVGRNGRRGDRFALVSAREDDEDIIARPSAM